MCILESPLNHARLLSILMMVKRQLPRVVGLRWNAGLQLEVSLKYFCGVMAEQEKWSDVADRSIAAEHRSGLWRMCLSAPSSPPSC